MGVHVRSARPRATGGNAVRRTRGATLKRRTNAPDDVVEFLALGLLGPRRHLLPLLHHARTPRHLRRSSPAEGRVTGVPLSWLRRGTMSVFRLFSLRRKAPAACVRAGLRSGVSVARFCWVRDGQTDRHGRNIPELAQVRGLCGRIRPSFRVHVNMPSSV